MTWQWKVALSGLKTTGSSFLDVTDFIKTEQFIQKSPQIDNNNHGRKTRKNSSWKKRACQVVDIAIPADHKLRLKRKQKVDKYLDLAWELIKAVEHEGDGDTNYSWYPWNSPQKLGKETGGTEIRGKIKTIQTAALLSQNIQKSPVELMRLVVTLISV